MSGMCRFPSATVVAVRCDIVAAHPWWVGGAPAVGRRGDGLRVSTGTTGAGAVFLRSLVTGWTAPEHSVRWRCRPRGGNGWPLRRAIGGRARPERWREGSRSVRREVDLGRGRAVEASRAARPRPQRRASTRSTTAVVHALGGELPLGRARGRADCRRGWGTASVEAVTRGSAASVPGVECRRGDPDRKRAAGLGARVSCVSVVTAVGGGCGGWWVRVGAEDRGVPVHRSPTRSGRCSPRGSCPRRQWSGACAAGVRVETDAADRTSGRSSALSVLVPATRSSTSSCSARARRPSGGVRRSARCRPGCGARVEATRPTSSGSPWGPRFT